MIFGRFLGTFFGFLFGGPLGAVLGFLIGYHFDRSLLITAQQHRFNPTPEQQQEFLIATFGVMGHLAKASGHVSKEEIQTASYYMDKMGLTGDLREQAQRAFREGKSHDFGFDATLEGIGQTFRGQRDILRFFLEMQIQAALADGDIDTTEQALLARIAQRLGISGAEFRLLLQMASGSWQRYQQGGYSSGYDQQQGYGHAQKLSRAYQVLGVDANASDQEVKKTYRKEMAKHHPDKLAAKGLPPEMMELAKQKAQEIQEAWEIIRQQRDIR